MTAPAVTTAPPLQRVTCPCSWSGVRRNPTGRGCPACGGPRERIETLWQVGHGPHQSIIYVLHFHWPYGRVDPWRIRLADGSVVRFHADHYSGKPASSGLLKVGWRFCGGEFAELAWWAWLLGGSAPGEDAVAAASGQPQADTVQHLLDEPLRLHKPLRVGVTGPAEHL